MGRACPTLFFMVVPLPAFQGRAGHDVENLGEKVEGNLLVKEIAHAIDEDPAGFPPLQGLHEAVLVQLDLGEPLSPPFCNPLGVAEFTPGADLGAAGHRVPRRLGPFDASSISHDLSL
jgi:hypothetical protein